MRSVEACPPARLRSFPSGCKELEAAGVVERRTSGASTTYALTEAGRELFPLIQGLGEWGQRWVRSDYRPDDLDPGLLLWDVRRFLSPGEFDVPRVVLQLTFPSMPAKSRYFWIVVDGHDVDLCLIDPGFDVDVTIEADLRTLTEVWMGDARFVDGLANGRIKMVGPTDITRRIPEWFGQHPILAGIARGG